MLNAISQLAVAAVKDQHLAFDWHKNAMTALTEQHNEVDEIIEHEDEAKKFKLQDHDESYYVLGDKSDLHAMVWSSLWQALSPILIFGLLE